jgi:glucokinase
MAKYYLGCDLGGTNMRAAIVDVDSGAVSFMQQTPTLAREEPEAIIIRMGNLLNAVMAASGLPKTDLRGIGVGVPGTANVPLADKLLALTGLKAHLLGDVRSITLGEWKFGAGRGIDTLACFAIGTGVGGGVVINNRLHLGLDGAAGELGHQTLDPHAPACNCGNPGCVEVFTAAPQIIAMGIKAVILGHASVIGKLADYDLNKVTPDLICAAARQGDQVALEIYERVGFYMGLAIANICVILAPKMVILAGGVAEAGELLLEPIRRTMRQHVFMMPVEKVQVVQARLGNNAGVIGAAWWAYERAELGYKI